MAPPVLPSLRLHIETIGVRGIDIVIPVMTPMENWPDLHNWIDVASTAMQEPENSGVAICPMRVLARHCPCWHIGKKCCYCDHARPR
jgi:hypothetical protein